ncbi:hypothetical protein MCEGEM3_01981 [Oxalobacteraceae bacterium]
MLTAELLPSEFAWFVRTTPPVIDVAPEYELLEVKLMVPPLASTVGPPVPLIVPLSVSATGLKLRLLLPVVVNECSV